MAPDPDRNKTLPTRWSLIARLKDLDDQQSWREFVDIYGKLIFGFAAKSGLTETEAQDVVQETVIAISKKMPEFDADPRAGSFKAFLFAITRRRIADQFKRRLPGCEGGAWGRDETARTATVERIADPAGLDLDAVWNREWEKNLMDTAMERVKRQINLKQCQIYDLYVVKQWPVLKVADTLGVNRGEVYLAKHRVARLLKKELKRLADRLDRLV